jgi:hypothetical protein
MVQMNDLDRGWKACVLGAVVFLMVKLGVWIPG